MTNQFLIYAFLIFSVGVQAQSKEMLEKYISDNLSYQHIKYKTAGQESQISIYQIEIKNCTMSYPVFIKKGDKTERFTVRILLSGTNDITIVKSKEGFYAITFKTNGKSILKEYTDGTLVHEKIQIIPLKKYDAKALEYFKKLKGICEKKSTE
ncbi:hypothetical protein [Flavobacterium sp. 245]|uniref:hypothetical protein n=1 Tax=Flavobacterium sp. 245 TaxID=2512115 RepID=UPI00105C4F37|nr:hypothetical protein [Flavobacterium sp. 245]TDP00714.1 hypothetical protein EV145_10593 [Flavobacterium sp. 245]